MKNGLKKIIMVDDDPVILKIGKHFLKDIYEVYPVPSATKLFDLLEKVTPDLILLDVNMPEISGVEAIKRLKADDRYASIPTIFVTAVDDDTSVFEQLQMGAYSNLSKPFTAEELTTRIENCLNDYFPKIPEKKAPETEKPTLLVIDDSPEVISMVFLHLRSNYKVTTLPDPQKLQYFMETTKPDLIIADYGMLTRSGEELMPVIRSFPQHQNTPVIYLAPTEREGNPAEATRLGATDYIIKPIDIKTLRETIAKHI